MTFTFGLKARDLKVLDLGLKPRMLSADSIDWRCSSLIDICKFSD